jgi:hypothetical protein
MFGPFKGMNFRSQVSLYLHSRTGVSRSDLGKITETNRPMLESQRLAGTSAEDAAENLCIRVFLQHFLMKVASEEEALSIVYGSAFRSAMTLSQFGFEVCKRYRRSELEFVFAFCWNSEDRWIRKLAYDLKSNGIISQDFFDTLEESDNWMMGGKLEKIVNSMPEWLSPLKTN